MRLAVRWASVSDTNGVDEGEDAKDNSDNAPNQERRAKNESLRGEQEEKEDRSLVHDIDGR